MRKTAPKKIKYIASFLLKSDKVNKEMKKVRAKTNCIELYDEKRAERKEKIKKEEYIKIFSPAIDFKRSTIKIKTKKLKKAK